MRRTVGSGPVVRAARCRDCGRRIQWAQQVAGGDLRYLALEPGALPAKEVPDPYRLAVTAGIARPAGTAAMVMIPHRLVCPTHAARNAKLLAGWPSLAARAR